MFPSHTSLAAPPPPILPCAPPLSFPQAAKKADSNDDDDDSSDDEESSDEEGSDDEDMADAAPAKDTKRKQDKDAEEEVRGPDDTVLVCSVLANSFVLAEHGRLLGVGKHSCAVVEHAMLLGAVRICVCVCVQLCWHHGNQKHPVYNPAARNMDQPCFLCHLSLLALCFLPSPPLPPCSLLPRRSSAWTSTALLQQLAVSPRAPQSLWATCPGVQQRSRSAASLQTAARSQACALVSEGLRALCHEQACNLPARSVLLPACTMPMGWLLLTFHEICIAFRTSILPRRACGHQSAACLAHSCR